MTGVDPDGSVDVLIEGCNITSGDGFANLHSVLFVVSGRPQSQCFTRYVILSVLPQSQSVADSADCWWHADCVAIKSGRDADAWQIGQPTQNVIVRDTVCNGHGNGICVGSEMSGGVSNVIVLNVTVQNSETALYFKSNLDRGAWVKDVVVDGMKVDNVKSCIDFDNNYHGARGGNFPTLFQNYSIRNVICNNVKETAISVDGLPNMPVRVVSLHHVVANNVHKATSFKGARDFVFDDVVIDGKQIPAPKSSK